jgi:bifunctional non-homologous end joining protein LigD
MRNDPWRASTARWLRIPPVGFVRPCEPKLVESVRALIDEAVMLRDDGRSGFAGLMTKRGGFIAALIAFDLLRLDGEDWRERPIEKRRETLARLIAGADGVEINEALDADGAVAFAKACELGLEAKPPAYG